MFSIRRRLATIALLIICLSRVVSAASVVFLEAGTASTYGTQFYSVTGTVTSDGTTFRANSRSLKVTSANAIARAQSTLADAGRRIDFWVLRDVLTTDEGFFLACSNNNDGVSVGACSLGTTLFSLETSSIGTISLKINGTVFSTFAALTVNRWARIAISYVITTTTNFTIKVWVYDNDGTTLLGSVTKTNADKTLSGTGTLMAGFINITSTTATYFSDLYIDDGTTLDDVGNVRVTPKTPAANNTNNFDTQVGSSANRWDDVNERALSEAKGWSHTAATNVQENYTLQTVSQGDIDITGATLLGRTAWIWAKRGALGTQITFRTAHSANANTVNITTPAVNDIILCFAFNNATTTIPTLPAGYTSISTSTTTGAAERIGYKLSAGSETNSGVWTNGTNIACNIYRGIDTTTPIGNHTPTAGNSAILTYGAITYAVSDGSSLGTGFGGAKSATAGMNGTTAALTTNRTNQTTINGLDTTSGGTALASSTLTVTTSGRWLTETVELRSSPETLAPKLMDNGTETAVTLTTSSALFSVVSTSASYPSNVAGIGMRSTATTADTFFYEGGTMIAYIPAVGGGAACTPTLMLLGVGRCG